jgi:hypothetical protein
LAGGLGALETMESGGLLSGVLATEFSSQCFLQHNVFLNYTHVRLPGRS